MNWSTSDWMADRSPSVDDLKPSMVASVMRSLVIMPEVICRVIACGSSALITACPSLTFSATYRPPTYKSINHLDRVPAPFSCSRSEEHTSELQSRPHLVCRLLLEKKKKNTKTHP